MKTRNGFVSNSSSSSFVCDVCGAMQSGWDACLSDVGMYSCLKGHTFCDDHLVKNVSDVSQLKERLLRQYQEDEEDESPILNASNDELFDLWKDECDDDRYETPSCFCPICGFSVLRNIDALQYLLTKHNITKEELCVEVANKFDCYDSFIKYIKGKD